VISNLRWWRGARLCVLPRLAESGVTSPDRNSSTSEQLSGDQFPAHLFHRLRRFAPLDVAIVLVAVFRTKVAAMVRAPAIHCRPVAVITRRQLLAEKVWYNPAYSAAAAPTDTSGLPLWWGGSGYACTSGASAARAVEASAGPCAEIGVETVPAPCFASRHRCAGFPPFTCGRPVSSVSGAGSLAESTVVGALVRFRPPPQQAQEPPPPPQSPLKPSASAPVIVPRRKVCRSSSSSPSWPPPLSREVPHDRKSHVLAAIPILPPSPAC